MHSKEKPMWYDPSLAEQERTSLKMKLFLEHEGRLSDMMDDVFEKNPGIITLFMSEYIRRCLKVFQPFRIKKLKQWNERGTAVIEDLIEAYLAEVERTLCGATYRMRPKTTYAIFDAFQKMLQKEIGTHSLQGEPSVEFSFMLSFLRWTYHFGNQRREIKRAAHTLFWKQAMSFFEVQFPDHAEDWELENAWAWGRLFWLQDLYHIAGDRLFSLDRSQFPIKSQNKLYFDHEGKKPPGFYL